MRGLELHARIRPQRHGVCEGIEAVLGGRRIECSGFHMYPYGQWTRLVDRIIGRRHIQSLKIPCTGDWFHAIEIR